MKKLVISLVVFLMKACALGCFLGVYSIIDGMWGHIDLQMIVLGTGIFFSGALLAIMFGFLLKRIGKDESNY